jgi:hypothetical protein
VFGGADEAIARVQADVVRARERAQRLSELRARTASVRGAAVSRRRDVSVEVDQSGAVVDLQISDAALDRGGRGLAAELISLISAARSDAQRRLIDTAAEVLGEDDPVVGSLEATLAPPSRPGSGETGIRW